MGGLPIEGSGIFLGSSLPGLLQNNASLISIKSIDAKVWSF